MSSRERVLDTTMAVVRQRLGIEPPFFRDVRTQDATKPVASYFLLEENNSTRHHACKEEIYFRLVGER